MPAGLISHRSAPRTVERRVPSIEEGSPPVTRPRMLFRLGGPVKVTLPPPRRRSARSCGTGSAADLPEVGPTSTSGPVSLTLRPSVPSVAHLGVGGREREGERVEQGRAEDGDREAWEGFLPKRG
jgi:hypothetical protein